MRVARARSRGVQLFVLGAGRHTGWVAGEEKSDPVPVVSMADEFKPVPKRPKHRHVVVPSVAAAAATGASVSLCLRTRVCL